VAAAHRLSTALPPLRFHWLPGFQHALLPHTWLPSHAPHPFRRAKLEQELQAHQLSDEQRAAALADHERREREFSRLQRQRLCMEDFEPLRLIGKGAFGEVRICRDRSTGQLVAVKKLKKAEMVRRGQVGAGAAAGSSSQGRGTGQDVDCCWMVLSAAPVLAAT
jgi:serine/threonine protein kinase